MKIACIGEAMVELALDEDGRTAQVGVAGDTLNTAIYLQRAAPNLDVSFVTRLGRDAFSGRLKQFIANERIATDQIEISDDRSVGLYAITTDATGERSFAYWRDNSAARQMFQSGEGFNFSKLEQFDLIYFSAIRLAILPEAARLEFCNWLPVYRAKKGRVVFDSNYRPALWTSQGAAASNIAAIWRQTDIALPSVDDECAIFGDKSVEETENRLREMGVREGALKCGFAGPRSLSIPVDQNYPVSESVIDTTAAGDSFNGGYLAGLLNGSSQKEALMAGHLLARKVVGVKGAIIPR